MTDLPTRARPEAAICRRTLDFRQPDAGPANAQPSDAETLAPLFAPLTSLRGIGPAAAGLIARAAGGDRVIDLLFHLPEAYLDRSIRPTIRAAQAGTVAP